MKNTPLIITVVVVVLAGLGWWYLGVSEPPVSAPQHVLMGTSTSNGAFLYEENGPYATIEAIYPASVGLTGEADTKARLYIEQSLADHIAAFKKNSNIDGLTPDEAAFIGIEGERKYALSLEYKAYESPEYRSFVYTAYEYTLGAHPNFYYRTFVFDQAGTVVSLKDIVSQSVWDTLASTSRSLVYKEYMRRSQDSGMEGDPIFFEEGFAPTKENYQAFVVDGGDLVVFFAPYQVAAYAAGAFEVRIPLSELR